MKTLLLSLFGMILLAPATGFAQNPPTGASQLETVFDYRIDDQGLVFQVYSGGCTQKSDFTLNILESYPVQLQLFRLKPDYCRAYFPKGVAIRFSFEELGLGQGETFYLNNPVQDKEIAVGFDRSGKLGTCEVKHPRFCTMVYTIEDEFSSQCVERGYQAITCDCHKYLCSEPFAFSSSMFGPIE